MSKPTLKMRLKTEAPKESRALKPKTTSQGQAPIKNKGRRVYSLVNPVVPDPTVNLLITRNTIIQLKISRSELDQYEQYGNWENNTIKLGEFQDSVPVAANSSAPVSEVPIVSVAPAADSSGSEPKKHPFSRFKGFTTKTRSSTQTDHHTQRSLNDSSYRRNLIINSGIIRKVSSIMSGFESEWPNTSQYDCWYCCYNFKTAPVGIPERMSKIDEQTVFHLYGNFCSYNCACRYLTPQNMDDLAMVQCQLDHNQSDQKAEQMQLLELLCHLETGHEYNQKIKPAPPRLTLARFGGKLSIDEFRSNFQHHNQFHIYKSPLVPIAYEMEEVDNIIKSTKPKRKNTTVALDQDRLDQAYAQLAKQRKNFPLLRFQRLKDNS